MRTFILCLSVRRNPEAEDVLEWVVLGWAAVARDGEDVGEGADGGGDGTVNGHREPVGLIWGKQIAGRHT